MIINRGTLSALFTGFNTQFQQAFETAPSDYARVAMDVPSNTRQETYGWLGKTTQFREWLGDRIIQNLESHDYTIKNKDYENTIAVDRNDIMDDTLGIYGPMFAQLGQDARVHPDQLVFALIKAGFTTLCFDGQFFFDTDHPVATGIVSNFGGGAGTAWYLFDTMRMIKPIIFQKRQDYKFIMLDTDQDEAVFMRKQFRYGIDARVNVGYGLWQLAYASKQTLDATNYQAARAAMMGFINDNGQPMNMRPNLLVVPPSLEGAARQLLNADMIANSAGTAGITNVYKGSADLLVTPWVI